MGFRKHSATVGLAGLVMAVVLGMAPRSASADPMYVWATNVESFTQGLQADGDPVWAHRSHPENALGEPTAPKIDGVDFVSLGFGGQIILSFGTVFSGEAAIIYETTYENIRPEYPEAVRLYISKTLNPDDFVFIAQIGNSAGSTMIQLSDYVPANDWFKYVMLVDATDINLFYPYGDHDGDGFDVNAVGVTPAIPLPSAAWAGLGLIGLLGAAKWRRAA